MNWPNGTEWYTYILELFFLFHAWVCLIQWSLLLLLKGFISKPHFNVINIELLITNNLLGFEFKETSRQSQPQKIIVLMLPSELAKNSSKNLMKIYQEALQSKKKHKVFQHLPKTNFHSVLKPLKIGL